MRVIVFIKKTTGILTFETVLNTTLCRVHYVHVCKTHPHLVVRAELPRFPVYRCYVGLVQRHQLLLPRHRGSGWVTITVPGSLRNSTKSRQFEEQNQEADSLRNSTKSRQFEEQNQEADSLRNSTRKQTV